MMIDEGNVGRRPADGQDAFAGSLAACLPRLLVEAVLWGL